MIRSIVLIVTLVNIGLTLSIQASSTDNRGEILDHNGDVIMLSPVSGYLAKKVDGRKGLQQHYNEHLAIGKNVPTSIHAQLQESTEIILDEKKVELNATEVLAMVMESKSGELITIASSNRYDPNHIRQVDISSLTQKFSEYLFEPGSIMKPISAAIALDRGVIDTNTLFKMYGGKLKFGKKRYISDDHQLEDNSTLEDIIVHSSNIGISQISWELSGKEFRDGLLAFGFEDKSGIDLRDFTGGIKSEVKLEHKLHRANTAYGYGVMVTLAQMVKAYSVFSNDGVMVTPHIGTVKTYGSQKVILKTTARQMKKVLVKVVENGTGINAKVEGLTIGGKTGTAHMAENGKYVKKYHSSFIGFAEDSTGRNYTIGVLVIDAKGKKKYYASQSAVPTFKKIVDEMVKKSLLVAEKKRDNLSGSTKGQKPLTLLSQRLNITQNSTGVSSYKGEKTISPLLDIKVLKPFGVYTDPVYDIKIFNESVTFKVGKPKAKVYCVADGKVAFVGKSKILGNVVVMDHANELYTVYAGLTHIAPTNRVGKKIGRAYVLGKVDEKLIFQIIQDGNFVNPMEVIVKKKSKIPYIKKCDFNGDGVSEYTLEDDVKNGVILRVDAIKEMKCMIKELKRTIAPLAWSKLIGSYGIDTDIKTGKKVFREYIVLASANKNAKVFNVLDGKVLYVGESNKLGKSVIIEHDDELYTIYGNLSIISPKVKKDKVLDKGFVLAEVEQLLMFQMNRSENNSTKTTSVNPMDYIDHKAFDGVFVKHCDFNNDGITEYRKGDVKNSFISKKEALLELKCHVKEIEKELNKRSEKGE